jgi:hypothetical protein
MSGVRPYSSSAFTVISDFRGLAYGNRFTLSNHEVWEQTEFHYEYAYAFRPRAVLFTEYGLTKIKIEGARAAVTVRRVY